MVPLIPYLRGVRRFAEPCCGDGDLVRHLESFGLHCVYAGDLRAGQDALALDFYGLIDAVITNPPYIREQMHRLIQHFQRIAPTWLLLEMDWASTRQAVPFMPSCSDIVAIGRVKWIAGSKNTGKDNSAWYRFDASHNRGPVFHCNDRGVIQAGRRRICETCGRSYNAERLSARFCSPACKQSAYRKRLSVTDSVTEPGEVFRYVRHADIPRFTAEGWERLPGLDGTHHGYLSALMRRRGR